MTLLAVATRNKRPQKQQISTTKTIPAPTGGWNARDSLAEMAENDAVILDDLFPNATDVQLRYGNSDHVTGVSGTVESLMPYQGASGTNALFGAAGASIYNMTSPGTVGAAVQTGLSNARWQWANFNATGTNLLYIVNGADAERYWNGSAWTLPTLTGITAGDAIGINIYAERIWFVLKNKLKVGYLPTAAISGAVALFDLGQIFRRGGYVMAMETWTLDAGYGMEDYAAFITSEGEVAVYRGTDPASAATWQRVGVFEIGSPMGRRCMAKWAGDALVINKDGLLPLSKALMSSRVNSTPALTDKIQKAISAATSQYSGNFGWQIQLFPVANMLILNVPVSTTVSYQYVMNTITGAWCRFRNWNAACWALFNDQIYFGTNGKVCRAWNTNTDGASNDINFEALQAFSDFQSGTHNKITKMVRPIITTNGTPALTLGINNDFSQTAPIGSPTFSGSVAGKWGVALWGSGLWGSQGDIKRDWQGATGVGYWAALHMKGACQGITLNWAATDYVYEKGGIV